MRRKGKFSAEVRARAVRLARESRSEHESEWAAIVSVPSKIGKVGADANYLGRARASYRAAQAKPRRR